MSMTNTCDSNIVRKILMYLGLCIVQLLILQLIGCATVNPNPFIKFETAVQEAQTGIDDAISVNYNWTKSGFAEGFSNDTQSKFSQLIIQPGQGYEWTISSKPIYLEIKQARSALYDLNVALSQYASILAKLAGGELISTDTFDQLTKDLNINMNDALKALNISAPTEVAIFSTASCELFRLYIENKRQTYLRDAIIKNQPNVQAYSNLCISLIHTIRGTLKAYYVDRIEPIKVAWNSSTGLQRQKLTETMLDLNEQFVDSMRILQELDRVYQSLPPSSR